MAPPGEDSSSEGLPWTTLGAPRRVQHAVECGRIAIRNGVSREDAFNIAFAGALLRVSQALCFALVEQESTFRHIYGHDPAGLFPGQPVTRSTYRQLVEHVRGGGISNGVGLMQITYGGYLIAHAGLWRRLANVKFGVGLINGEIVAHGKREGLARYNGGPTPPEESFTEYADVVLGREDKWRGRFE
jgi:hypothetical protein